MVFLLGSEPQNNGTTHIEYDHDPARRIQLVTLTENRHLAIAVPPDELFKHTLAAVRPPTSGQG